MLHRTLLVLKKKAISKLQRKSVCKSHWKFLTLFFHYIIDFCVSIFKTLTSFAWFSGLSKNFLTQSTCKDTVEQGLIQTQSGCLCLRIYGSRWLKKMWVLLHPIISTSPRSLVQLLIKLDDHPLFSLLNSINETKSVFN